MSSFKRLTIAACAALCVAAFQFSFVSQAVAQPDGPIGFSQVDRSGGEPKKAKFVELLKDQDLSHFRGYKEESVGGSWKIDGKFLVCDGSGGDLMTKETFQDFEMQYDWNISKGGNSGVMFRVTNEESAPYMTGPEIQVLDDESHADGQNETTSAGALYGLFAPADKKLRTVGSWNKAKLKVEGNKITHYLNGVKNIEVEIGSDEWNAKLADSKFKDWAKFAKNDRGHIVFQDHGNVVKYRNIRIKKIGVMVDKDGNETDPNAKTAGVEKNPGSNRPRPGDGGDSISAPPASKGGARKGGERRGPAGPPPGIGNRGEQGGRPGGRPGGGGN